MSGCEFCLLPRFVRFDWRAGDFLVAVLKTRNSASKSPRTYIQIVIRTCFAFGNSSLQLEEAKLAGDIEIPLQRVYKKQSRHLSLDITM